MSLTQLDNLIAEFAKLPGVGRVTAQRLALHVIKKSRIDAEALALMQDDFLELESLVLEGVSFNTLADSINASIQVTGLNNIEGIQLDGFDDINLSDLFDS